MDSVPRGSVTTYVVEVRNLGPDPVKGATGHATRCRRASVQLHVGM